MKHREISPMVVHRLPRYYRFLLEMEQDGMTKISSGELAKRMNLNASQIRQDLNCFGGFGQQGYGYHIPTLRAELGEILGVSQPRPAILLGAGNLGHALANYTTFAQKGLQLIGIFDINPALTGALCGGLPILHIDTLADFCRANKPEAAILCVDRRAAKELSDLLIRLGIRGFLNFSHYDIQADHPEIVAENVHIGDAMMTLRYQLAGHPEETK